MERNAHEANSIDRSKQKMMMTAARSYLTGVHISAFHVEKCCTSYTVGLAGSASAVSPGGTREYWFLHSLLAFKPMAATEPLLCLQSTLIDSRCYYVRFMLLRKRNEKGNDCMTFALKATRQFYMATELRFKAKHGNNEITISINIIVSTNN